jgi:hypothetical protein
MHQLGDLVTTGVERIRTRGSPPVEPVDPAPVRPVDPPQSQSPAPAAAGTHAMVDP